MQFKNGGEYDLSDEKLQDTVGIKLQNWRTKGTQFWELQKGHSSKAGTALDKILFRIWYLCWNLTYIRFIADHGRPQDFPAIIRVMKPSDCHGNVFGHIIFQLNRTPRRNRRRPVYELIENDTRKTPEWHSAAPARWGTARLRRGTETAKLPGQRRDTLAETVCLPRGPGELRLSVHPRGAGGAIVAIPAHDGSVTVAG